MWLLLGLMLALLVWIGFWRMALPPLPEIAFGDGRAFTLHITPAGCESLLGGCPHVGAALADDLYSLVVSQWSPDGDFMAVHESAGWRVYRTACLRSGGDCPSVPLDFADEMRLTWGPDGSLLAGLDANGQQLIVLPRACWDGSSPTACQTITIPVVAAQLLSQLHWSADGSRIVFTDFSLSGPYLLDTACFDLPRGGCLYQLARVRIPFNGTQILWPSLSPDGSQVMFSTGTLSTASDIGLFIVNIEDASTRQVNQRGNSPFMADWSPDGRYVVYSGFARPTDGDLSLFLVDLARGIEAVLLRQPGTSMQFPDWGSS
ncbi:MAG: PD40 domain-containing protein [Anaerolineae bacterium]|nr:PD40 domain-containing protein [Anaerolineae bacterium]